MQAVERFSQSQRGRGATSINGGNWDDDSDVDSDEFDQHSELLGEAVRQHFHSKT